MNHLGLKVVNRIKNILIKKKIIIGSIAIVILGAGLLVALFLNQNPLASDGFTEYDHARKKMDIELVNHGRFNVYIQDVLVNNKTPNKVQLVISYSGQLVAGGIDSSPWAKFVNIQDAPIHPRLSPEQIQEAVKTHSTPVHYGIRIYNDEDIAFIKIKYKYMGIPFTREINLDTWPE